MVISPLDLSFISLISILPSFLPAFLMFPLLWFYDTPLVHTCQGILDFLSAAIASQLCYNSIRFLRPLRSIPWRSF
nr:MAG TPA: hypothetical protein [Caudoviricetes sp.]